MGGCSKHFQALEHISYCKKQFLENSVEIIERINASNFFIWFC